MNELRELYNAERAAYAVYVAAKRGDAPGRVLPSLVRERKQIWDDAVAALRAGGGSPEAIRELLAEQAGVVASVRRWPR